MKRITTMALCSVIAFIACDVNAQDSKSGWQIGGGVSVAAFKRDDRLINDTSMGVKLFAQYRFNSWFGLEGAYLNTGEFESSATSADGSKVDLLYQGPQLQAIGYIPTPMDELDLFIKGGYFKFDVDSTTDGANSGSGTDNGVILGFGGALRVTESIHFRTEFDWYEADKADLWAIGLAFEYHF